eukprot:3417639-Rhodomonas_salina.1
MCQTCRAIGGCIIKERKSISVRTFQRGHSQLACSAQTAAATEPLDLPPSITTRLCQLLAKNTAISSSPQQILSPVLRKCEGWMTGQA